MAAFSPRLVLAERLTLAVLLSGVASLALSDFVSTFYWGLVVTAAAIRLWAGPRFALSEMQASLIGWAGFLWVGIELALGRPQVVAFTDFLLILSLAIVVESATPRNHLHRMLVGFFLILGAAVLTDSVLYIFPLAAFVIFVWRASHCLYGMQLPGGDLPVSRWRSEVPMLLSIGVGAALLFVVLPRYDFQSYLKPVQPRMDTSGFSDNVNLGDFARELDTTVIMRVEPTTTDAKGFMRAMGGRYWRGVVLSRFNGSGWQRQPEVAVRQWPKGSSIVFARHGKGDPFAVYRDASDHAYLLLPNGIGTISDIPDSLSLGDQGVMRFLRAPDRRVRIVMRLGDDASESGMRPPVTEETERSTVPAAVRRWAEKTAAADAEPSLVMAQLLNEMKRWEYDLNAPIDGNDPVGSFLELKRGHCELYATALALAARWRGIPARVVNGYRGGEWNDVGGFYLIRAQHAHSWVEAWIDGGWRRFDSTPSSRWQLSGVRFPAIDKVWESIKMSWYRYVLEFQDADRSLALTALISLLRENGLWLMLTLAGGVAVFMLHRRGIRWSLPRMRGRQICMLDRWLRQRGVERVAFQPVRHVGPPRGIEPGKWLEFVVAWERQAYAEKEKWSVRELKRHLRAL